MSGHLVVLYETDYLYYHDEDGREQTVYVVPCGSKRIVMNEAHAAKLCRKHNEVRLARKEHQVAVECKIDAPPAPAPPAVTHTAAND